MSGLTESQKVDPQSCTHTQVMPKCDANAPEIGFPIFVESLGYEQLAEELSTFFGKPVSKNTLKNNWLNAGGRIDRIYQGLDLPLKTDSGRVTPFGINAVFEFAALVHFGSKHYDDYVLSIQTHYLSGVFAESSDVAEPADESAFNADILPFEVEVGNHQKTLPPPALPQIYTLQGLRSGESVQIDDPIALANQVVQAINRVQDVMKNDLRNREQKLQETKQAQKTVDAKVQELKLDQRFYQEKANQVDFAQTETTQMLQEAISVLQDLGKHQPDPQDS